MISVPKQTGEIFELLSKGQFICSNSSDIRIAKLYEIIDDKDHYDLLYDYFLAINFVLEKGDEFYYLSRKNESKADLERKLRIACRWIDIVDFLKTYDNAFGAGYSFAPSDIETRIRVDVVLKNKAEQLRKVLDLDDKTPFNDIISKIIDTLCKEGFAELENEILISYKILSSFKYLEELIQIINIPEEIQDEIPE